MVQPEIAKFTRVCNYDRAGLGWSDPGPLPRTSRQFVKELRVLLTNAGIKGPYVLAGHSLGGMNMRLYAALYPDDVASMVLVDSGHEDQSRLFPKIKDPFAFRVLKTPLLHKSLSVLGVNTVSADKSGFTVIKNRGGRRKSAFGTDVVHLAWDVCFYK